VIRKRDLRGLAVKISALAQCTPWHRELHQVNIRQAPDEIQEINSTLLKRIAEHSVRSPRLSGLALLPAADLTGPTCRAGPTVGAASLVREAELAGAGRRAGTAVQVFAGAAPESAVGEPDAGVAVVRADSGAGEDGAAPVSEMSPLVIA
jgi:hypothetical protein